MQEGQTLELVLGVLLLSEVAPHGADIVSPRMGEVKVNEGDGFRKSTLVNVTAAPSWWMRKGRRPSGLWKAQSGERIPLNKASAPGTPHPRMWAQNPNQHVVQSGVSGREL